MRWIECTMLEAFAHARYRDVDPEGKRPEGADFDEDVLVFTDGTAVAARSEWDCPLSEATPEISACEPKWRVYR